MFSPDYSHHIKVLENIDKEIKKIKMWEEFHKIITTDEPNCVDTLDGLPLENGEKLEIIWPDYAHTFETVHVKTWNTKMKDGIVLYSKAHIIIFWKTVPAKIRVVGLQARRIK